MAGGGQPQAQFQHWRIGGDADAGGAGGVAADQFGADRIGDVGLTRADLRLPSRAHDVGDCDDALSDRRPAISIRSLSMLIFSGRRRGA
jgi:hypothetical protein